MFPDFFRASGIVGARYHLIFDLLIAAGLALATSCIGVMAAFGLVFVPSMIAYRIGPNWKASVGICSRIQPRRYLVAFAAALLLDQPFGPVLVVTLAALAIFGWLALFALQRRAPTGLAVPSPASTRL